MAEQFLFNKIFLTKGVGVHKEKLASFEMALRQAEIARFNLVKVSSIIPPGCKIIPRSKGLEQLKSGQVVYLVLARAETNEPNRMVSASIGLAIPRDPTKYGYISEHHCFGQTAKEVGEYAEDLAASMLASTLGVKFDIDKAWDTRREQFKVAGHIVKTQNKTTFSRGDLKHYWTTAIAAAVFVP